MTAAGLGKDPVETALAFTRVRGHPRVVETGGAPVNTERVVFAHGAVERERAELLEALMRPE